MAVDKLHLNAATQTTVIYANITVPDGVDANAHASDIMEKLQKMGFSGIVVPNGYYPIFRHPSHPDEFLKDVKINNNTFGKVPLSYLEGGKGVVWRCPYYQNENNRSVVENKLFARPDERNFCVAVYRYYENFLDVGNALTEVGSVLKQLGHRKADFRILGTTHSEDSRDVYGNKGPSYKMGKYVERYKSFLENAENAHNFVWVTARFDAKDKINWTQFVSEDELEFVRRKYGRGLSVVAYNDIDGFRHPLAGTHSSVRLKVHGRFNGCVKIKHPYQRHKETVHAKCLKGELSKSLRLVLAPNGTHVMADVNKLCGTGKFTIMKISENIKSKGIVLEEGNFTAHQTVSGTVHFRK